MVTDVLRAGAAVRDTAMTKQPIQARPVRRNDAIFIQPRMNTNGHECREPTIKRRAQKPRVIEAIVLQQSAGTGFRRCGSIDLNRWREQAAGMSPLRE